MSTKKQVDTSITNFEKKNGSLDQFDVKQVILLLHEETQNNIKQCHKKIDETGKKFEEHIKWSNNNLKWGNKVVREHDKLFAKIMQLLPQKGFCENVTSELRLDKEITLADQVETLWHDRRWIKAILIALIGVGGVTVLNILIQVFG